MAHKCFCDQCGAEDAFRVYLSPATAGGNKIPKDYKFPDADADMCFRCFDRMMTAIKAIWPKPR